MNYDVYYFDGKSSKPYETTLDVYDDYIELRDVAKRYSFAEITIGPKLNNTPQKISFNDEAYCEIKNDAHFTLPGQTGGKFVLHLEKKLKYALIAFASIIILTILSLTFGSTYIANIVSEKMPQKTVNLLSKNVLEIIDKNYLEPTKLDKKKRDYLTQEFQKMVRNSKHDYTLYFRSSELMGPNAFALPSGEVILLDTLVELDDDPKLRGILGILAHEAGHVEHKHGLKSITKASITSAILGYLIGDFSGFASMLGTFTLNARYSREFEDEADAYAIKLTKENNISTKYIADIFIKLHQQNNNASDSLFDSHPSMQKRIDIFREEH